MFKDLWRLFFPNLCSTCKNELKSEERVICINCLSDIQLQTFHFENENNEIALKFLGKVKFESANAFFIFDKGGKLQHLIHLLKYNKKSEIGIVLGEFAAIQLNLKKYFPENTVLVPIPLHADKLKKRGYNQAEMIAKGISKSTGFEVIPFLKRTIFTETQTKKSKSERWKSLEGVFEMQEKFESEKHYILVDDVLTTGSTLISALKAFPDSSKVSILTLASAN